MRRSTICRKACRRGTKVRFLIIDRSYPILSSILCPLPNLSLLSRHPAINASRRYGWDGYAFVPLSSRIHCTTCIFYETDIPANAFHGRSIRNENDIYQFRRGVQSSRSIWRGSSCMWPLGGVESTLEWQNGLVVAKVWFHNITTIF